MTCERCKQLEAELERWRHGTTIEGDFVCPDSLRMVALEAAGRMFTDWYDYQTGTLGAVYQAVATALAADGHAFRPGIEGTEGGLCLYCGRVHPPPAPAPDAGKGEP